MSTRILAGGKGGGDMDMSARTRGQTAGLLVSRGRRSAGRGRPAVAMPTAGSDGTQSEVLGLWVERGSESTPTAPPTPTPDLQLRSSLALACTSSTQSDGNQPTCPRALPSQKPPSPTLRTEEEGGGERGEEEESQSHHSFVFITDDNLLSDFLVMMSSLSTGTPPPRLTFDPVPLVEVDLPLGLGGVGPDHHEVSSRYGAVQLPPGGRHLPVGAGTGGARTQRRSEPPNHTLGLPPCCWSAPWRTQDKCLPPLATPTPQDEETPLKVRDKTEMRQSVLLDVLYLS